MSAVSLTLDEVLTAERPAWATSADDPDVEFYYDGIIFWHRSLSGANRAAVDEELPPGGWRHRSTCTCSLCRPA